MPATWEYKGVTITLDDLSGQFVVLDKTRVKHRAPSLDAMKAKLDKTFKIAFEPFEALSYEEPHSYVGGKSTPGKMRAPRKVEQLHTPVGRLSYRNSAVFLVLRGAEGTGHYHMSSVIPNTKENRQAVQALITAQHNNNIVRAKMRAEEEALEAVITYVDAMRYAVGDKRALTKAEAAKL